MKVHKQVSTYLCAAICLILSAGCSGPQNSGSGGSGSGGGGGNGGTTYTIGGTVAGLAGSGLKLANNGGDTLSVGSNGSFTFATGVASGAAYAVTVSVQPTSPAQTCIVANGSGTATQNINTVQVNCSAVTYSISGTVVGLVGDGGGMELQDNGGDNLLITGNGPFAFPTALASGGVYNVTIFTQPTTQTELCTVNGGTGNANAAINNIIVDCAHNDWTWMQGSNIGNQAGQYTNPAPVPDTNTPGARNFPATWTDNLGDLWLFGGIGYTTTQSAPAVYLNDVWKYSAGHWSQITSSGTPVGRWGAATWTDASGKFWLFGGQNSSSGLLNDLWVFDPGTTTWTMKKGSTTPNQKGTYGTLGTAADANVPGGRWAADARVDSSGKVWMFGGQGYDSTGTSGNGLLNDLWTYDSTANRWTWVGGSNTFNQNGLYGTKGTAASANTPGGRQGAFAWMDNSDNFWVFGGFGLDSVGTPNGSLNDLWEYTGGQWKWVAGSNTANQNGSYGTLGTATASNTPGARWRGAAWADPSGNLWLFGGFGQDAAGNGLLSDLWEFKGGQWIWVKGPSSSSQAGVYNTANVPFVQNNPGGRWGPGYWTDNNGNLWLFGGQGYDSVGTSGSNLLNDMWRYLPYP